MFCVRTYVCACLRVCVCVCARVFLRGVVQGEGLGTLGQGLEFGVRREFRFWGLGFRVQGSGFGVCGLEIGASGLELGISFLL